MGIVSLADAKTFIGVESAVTTYDALLGSLINAADVQIPRYLGTAVESAVVTDSITACGYERRVFASNAPIRDTASLEVKENGTTLTEDTDYAVELSTGAFTRLSGYWSTISKAITLKYSAGFATVPADIKLAVLMQIKHQWQQRAMIGINSRSAEGNITIEEQPGTIVKGARALLDSYRRIAF